MSKDQKGFIVYGDIKAVIDELTDEQVSQLFHGMVDYFVDGTEPKFSGVLKFVFIPIKQQMDRDASKYEKKCERMRENANKRWNDAKAYKSMQLDANDANTNTDTNTKTDKDTDTDTMSAETDARSLSLDLINHLNEKTGSRYVVDDATVGRVQTLMDAGYTPNQMRTVIDKKYSEWYGDEKMRGYLRPSTLFGDKFGEYLNAPVSIQGERQKKRDDDRKSLLKQKQEKTAALDSMRSSIEELRDADGHITKMSEYRALKDQIAIAEDALAQIDRRLEVS